MSELLTSTALSIIAALIYVLYGYLKALYVDDDSFNPNKILPAVAAGIFLAVVAPDVIPTLPPGDLTAIVVAAMTSFETLGAIYVTTKIGALFWALLKEIRNGIMESITPHGEGL